MTFAVKLLGEPDANVITLVKISTLYLQLEYVFYCKSTYQE